MPDPSARDALLALAAEFDAIADGMRTDSYKACYRAAARSARERAQAEPHGQVEAEVGTGRGGDAERGSVALRAAADAITRELDSGDIHETHVEHDEQLAHVALEAAAPHIVAAERQRILSLAEPLKVTLSRPGYGSGPAHGESLDVVPWGKLAELLGGTPDA